MNEQIFGLEWSQEQISEAFQIEANQTGSDIDISSKDFRAKYTFSGNGESIRRLHIEARDEQIVFIIDGISGQGYVAQFNNKHLHTHHGKYELMLVMVRAIGILGWVVPIQDWGQHLETSHERVEFVLELESRLTHHIEEKYANV